MKDMKRYFIESMHDGLSGLVGEKVLSAEQAVAVNARIDRIFVQWVEDVQEAILDRARDWEAVMGDEDKSLYSLGLRRAADIVTGRDVFEQLPILERPEYLPAEE